MLTRSSINMRHTGSGITTDPTDPTMRETRGSKGPKLWDFYFFLHRKTRNLMSPDAVSEAPKCAKIRFWPGFCPDPAGELTALPQTSYLHWECPIVRERSVGEKKATEGKRKKTTNEGRERKNMKEKRKERGVQNDFLAGSPKFEVTPLHTGCSECSGALRWREAGK